MSKKLDKTSDPSLDAQNLTYSSHLSFYNSPLPPASEIEKLHKIDPSFAERVFKLAESEQKHRHLTDEKLLSQESIISSKALRDRNLGQFFAFIITLVLVFFGAWIVISGKSTLGGTFMAALGPVLIALSRAFLKNESKN